MVRIEGARHLGIDKLAGATRDEVVPERGSHRVAMRLAVHPARDVNVLKLKIDKVVTEAFATPLAWWFISVKGATGNKKHEQAE